jgi:lipoprotein-releasing system permease protein
MKLTLHIAWRFLLAKKRAMLMSLAGIILGVAFFIVTQAQAQGFQKFFVDTILGINGAIRVNDEWRNTITSMDTGEGGGFQVSVRESGEIRPGISQPRAVKEAVLGFSEVTGASEVLRGSVQFTSGFKERDGRLFGVNIVEYLEVSDLAAQVIAGDLDRFREIPDGLILGTILANRLQLNIGDVLYVQGSRERRRFRLTTIIETGVELYDRTSGFVHMREARAVLNRGDGADYIQVALRNSDEAPALAAHLQDALRHSVDSWQDREKSWLEVFRLLRVSSAITMGVILLIAGLGIFSTLAIIVMERRREIAILRSMGFSQRDISRIFLNQGLIVLGVGTLGGWILAVVLTFALENIPIHIRGIFSTNQLVMAWSFWHYLQAALLAGVMVFIASTIPARRAARVEPAAIIRGSGA